MNFIIDLKAYIIFNKYYNMPKIVTAQLSDKMVKEVEEFMSTHGIDRSTAIRKLLEKSLDQWKIERAVSKYMAGTISLMKASEIAGLSLWEFIDELQKRDITINISIDAIEESLGM
jgi:predicted HTH domain antitoxin